MYCTISDYIELDQPKQIAQDSILLSFVDSHWSQT
jgi:hypothetical protein